MKVLIPIVLMSAALAREFYPRTSYPTRSSNNVRPSFSTAINSFNELLHSQHPPRPYKFAYAVEDPPSRNSYGHSESSDGRTVSGTYRILLPDGRNQIVTYKADDNGYVADVQYEDVVNPSRTAPAPLNVPTTSATPDPTTTTTASTTPHNPSSTPTSSPAPSVHRISAHAPVYSIPSPPYIVRYP